MRRMAAYAAVLAAVLCRETRGDVLFELASEACASQVDSVFVAGSFNNWSTKAAPMMLVGTTWTARLSLLDGRHYYKFVWRDAAGETHWLTDPRNLCMADDGHGGANSIVDVEFGQPTDKRVGLEFFELRAPSRTKWANIAGDFNNWRQGQFLMPRVGSNTWQIYLAVQPPVTYKYIYDGKWEAFPGGADYTVPDGYGDANCVRRPRRGTVAPEEYWTQPVAAGDGAAALALEQLMTERLHFAKTRDLARKIAQANGPKSPLTFRAIELEGELYRRWGMPQEAAQCWKNLVALDRESTPARRVIPQLTAHYIYVEKEYGQARELALERIARSADPLEGGRAAIDLGQAFRKEKRYADALAVVDLTLDLVGKPDGSNNDKASLYSELWLLKAFALYESSQREAAREAFRRVVEYSPWPDSQPAITADRWLRGMERKDRQK